MSGLIKVLHFVNDDRGGVGRYVESLVAAQLLRGNEVGVMGPRALNVPGAVLLHGYRPVRFAYGLNQWKFAAASAFVQSSGRLRHSHSPHFGMPDVHTFHGFYARNWLFKNRRDAARLPARAQFEALSALEFRLIRRSRAAVFVSSENRDYVESELGIRRPGSFHVILPGVDCAAFRPRREARAEFPQVDPAARWAVFAGHDYDGKGLLRLLEQPLPGVELLVFGDDPPNRARAVERAARSGISAHFMADGSRLRDAFGAADALVMDSRSEGFPLVLFEAMASGCVPFVTSFAGVSDAFEDGRQGRVLADAAGIARALGEARPEELQRMSGAARERVLARSWGKVAEEYAELYRTL